jgi:hypothetical protein
VCYGGDRDECTTDPAADREPVVFDLARYGQRQSRMSVPGLRFDTHGTGLSLALFGWGVAFDLKQRRHHAALTSHGISSAARRARTNAEARGGSPAAAMAGLLPAADNPRICSGKSLGSGAAHSAAAQLRTHSPGGAVDRR